MIKLLALFLLLTQPVHAFGTNGCDNKAGFLMHMDTSSFTDEDCPGDGKKVVTNTGTILQNTTNFKFGGSSANFDGTTKYFSIPNDADTNWAGQFTVDCWIRTTDATADTQFRTIWTKGVTSSAGTLQLSIDTNGFPVVIDSAGGGSIEIQGTINVATGVWFHLSVSRDSANNMRCRVNGVQDGGTFSTAENYNAVQVFEIGIYGGNTTGRWNGQIDELRISAGVDRYPVVTVPPTTPYCSGCEMLEAA